jgi:iron complex transport system substrate-binding protein
MEPLSGDFNDPQYLIEVLEDLAEMLHPGYFVFGNEGKTWISFGV